MMVSLARLTLAGAPLLLWGCGTHSTDAGAEVAPEASHSVVWEGVSGLSSSSALLAGWSYYEDPPYVANDGLESFSSEGLRVVSKGVNAVTGEPAYSQTVPQDQSPGDIGGDNDGVKWLVYTSNVASSGMPGFDAVPGRELACEAWVSGRTFGTQFHPFGASVQDPEDDLRLASFGMATIDVETGMVFDILITNKRAYALYERLAFARTPENQYGSYTYAIPLKDLDPTVFHQLKITYDRSAGVVRWIIDGRELFRVNQIGRRIDSRWLFLDHGGLEQSVAPRQLNCGMGTFALLDGYLPTRPLVRLSGREGYYTLPAGQTFFDDESLPGNRLFGQGAELRVKRYVVSSTAVR